MNALDRARQAANCNVRMCLTMVITDVPDSTYHV